MTDEDQSSKSLYGIRLREGWTVDIAWMRSRRSPSTHSITLCIPCFCAALFIYGVQAVIRGSWSIGRRLEEGGQASGEPALHRGGVRSHLRRWPLGAAVVLASSHVQSPGAYLHEIPLHFPTFRRLLSCSATKAFVVVFLSVNLYNLTSYILSGRECMGGSFSTHNSIIEY